jgi:hypothetical protein
MLVRYGDHQPDFATKILPIRRWTMMQSSRG